MSLGWLGRSKLRHYKGKFKDGANRPPRAGGPYKKRCSRGSYTGLTVGRGAERDVDDGFEVDGGALFGGGAEFPLAEGLHGVGIELLIDAAHQLDAVDRTVAADYGIEYDFTLDMLVN